jgi:hypothetical protein
VKTRASSALKTKAIILMNLPARARGKIINQDSNKAGSAIG